MPSLGKPYLCGGIFLTQLMQARKSRAGVRERYAGESDGLSDPETMLAFIKVVCPDFTVPAGKTFKETPLPIRTAERTVVLIYLLPSLQQRYGLLMSASVAITQRH